MSANVARKPFGRLFAAAAIFGVLFEGTVISAETTDRVSDDGTTYPALTPGSSELSAELQAIQQSLGGSSVNQFPSLRGDAPLMQGRLRTALEERSALRGGAHRDAIRALREAAAQLDGSANRLESLELYAQADALRQLAQQLRIDARTSSGTLQGEPTRPTPAHWTDPRPALEPLWNDVGPTPTDQLAPRPAPQALEPVPQPENRNDRPKPQPLLDSPQEQPKPDVEVEG